jgi:hypothetical protein
MATDFRTTFLNSPMNPVGPLHLTSPMNRMARVTVTVAVDRRASRKEDDCGDPHTS